MTSEARLAISAFWVLFPGFFVYHAVVAMGLPPMLRGYSVAAAAMTLPLLTLAWLQATPERRRLSDPDVLVLGFVIMLLVASSWHAVQGAAADIVSAHLGVVPQWLVLYGVARLYPWGSLSGHRSLLAGWLVMTLLVFVQTGEAEFVAASLDLPPAHTDDLATYQDFGLLYLMVTLAILPHTARAGGRFLVLAPALVVLFLNGARSEFLALLLAAILLGWLLSRWRVAYAAIALAAVMAAPLSFEPLASLLPDNRIVDLIENQASASRGEREEMLVNAWSTLAKHPVAGDYGSYPPGEYAHNALSAWVDLGAAGFAWSVLMLLLPAVDLALNFRRYGRERLFLLAAAGILLSLLLLATAKSFTYNLVPFALGTYAAARIRVAKPAAATTNTSMFR